MSGGSFCVPQQSASSKDASCVHDELVLLPVKSSKEVLTRHRVALDTRQASFSCVDSDVRVQGGRTASTVSSLCVLVTRKNLEITDDQANAILGAVYAARPAMNKLVGYKGTEPMADDRRKWLSGNDLEFAMHHSIARVRDGKAAPDYRRIAFEIARLLAAVAGLLALLVLARGVLSGGRRRRSSDLDLV